MAASENRYFRGSFDTQIDAEYIIFIEKYFVYDINRNTTYFGLSYFGGIDRFIVWLID